LAVAFEGEVDSVEIANEFVDAAEVLLEVAVGVDESGDGDHVAGVNDVLEVSGGFDVGTNICDGIVLDEDAAFPVGGLVLVHGGDVCVLDEGLSHGGHLLWLRGMLVIIGGWVTGWAYEW
jgi:hypothetical protein